MSMPDDPEARIRDLEQPLGDARAGQYPGGSYGPPATQPWPSEPPPPHQPATAGSDRPRWLSNLLLGLGLLVIIGAVCAYLLFGREPTPGTPVSDGRTTVASTPPALPTTPGNRPQATVPVIPLPPTVGSSEPTTAAPNGKVSVSGIDEHRTVVCDGGSVDVSGISNTVVITGHCGLVIVSGIENVVTVDSADRIEASGISNRVTFHSGAPEVNNSGSENTVEQG
jgi:hypothetical protein